MEIALATKNADRYRMGDLATPSVRMYGKQATKAGNYPNFVWENPLPGSAADGIVNGYAAWISNLLASNGTKGTGTNLSQFVFANWEDLHLALWEGVDLLADPYTGRSNGILKISSLYAIDVQVAHAESFCIVNDADTTLPNS